MNKTKICTRLGEKKNPNSDWRGATVVQYRRCSGLALERRVATVVRFRRAPSARSRERDPRTRDESSTSEREKSGRKQGRLKLPPNRPDRDLQPPPTSPEKQSLFLDLDEALIHPQARSATGGIRL
ncbi:hypothetical protein TIFTF001_035226 [Ficus carica]|uniref:FCP1 homology domain-containing protein n=1 Tax=Ficus carica TaxID=3494 RepID=A0AA88E217_FICCA|nr:hypothetical protein TIFTF001_035226 [Ficus carica]